MKISVKRKINAPSTKLWKYLADYSNIHRIHPLLKSSHFNEGSHSCEIGSTRQCDMKDGNYIKERITDWQEGSHYSVDIYESSMPVTSAKATLGVSPVDQTDSIAYMDVDVIPNQWFMTPMLYLSFRWMVMPGILKGLEKLYRKENEQLQEVAV